MDDDDQAWRCLSDNQRYALEERPDRDEMLQAAVEARRALGMEGHQTLVVRYRDEPHAHVHLILNRVHPETGRAAGYVLARGDRRDFVVIDRHGKTLNPARQLEVVRVREVRAKLADLDPARLPGAAEARALIERERAERQRRGPEIWDREAEARAREAREVEAAIAREIERQKQEEARARDAARERREREREAARERFRFEGWANRKRAELQSRQLDDRGELGRRHGRERDDLADELDATYGAGKRAGTEGLAEIERRREAGGWLYCASGRAERGREAAAALRRTLADIERREGEQRGRLKAAQAAKHRREARELEERIREASERREREGWRPFEPERRGAANDREREPDRAEETPSERVRRRRAERWKRERDPWDRGRDYDRER